MGQKQPALKARYASPFCADGKNTWTVTSYPYTPSYCAETRLYSVISRYVAPLIGPAEENYDSNIL
jgi:hypothetical protein